MYHRSEEKCLSKEGLEDFNEENRKGSRRESRIRRIMKDVKGN